jgi:hypothetical protein
MVKKYFLLAIAVLCLTLVTAQEDAQLWMKYEIEFTSTKEYGNPLYDLKTFYVEFIAPSGRTKHIDGFWDGGTHYKARFAPDELGEWSYRTTCSDKENRGLMGQTGTFNCVPNESSLEIYKKGSLQQPKGTYHLTYNDGTPFFFAGCTAWNGPLKSTDEEWATYLNHRVEHHYSVIQFVTTQWRGCDMNSQGEVAYEGGGQISINPSFYQHMDSKIDQINAHGLIAAPVLLWALPVGDGRHLSPGYALPLNEAVLLAKYMVARYGGHQVIWILGGDGRYAREYEQRWLEIGRQVFENDPPGLVAQHPHGRLWIGDNHAQESWLDIVGYQSSHSNAQGTVDWINKGPIANRWPQLPARPVINLEPNYEEIGNRITDEDVRNASYWSLFATPISGITYGANGIWPWIREGETILNHRQPPSHVSTWRKSINFPGSIQIGYLSAFMQKFEWWDFRPANELLLEQPGDSTYNHFISVVKSLDQKTVLVYNPKQNPIKLYLPLEGLYSGEWYDPRTNQYQVADLSIVGRVLQAVPPASGDHVLILRKEG